MSIMKYIGFLFLGSFLLLASSCTNNSSKKEASLIEEARTESPQTEVVPDPETQLLLDYLEDQGDYVNSREFPSMIKANTLFESLGQGTLVIDIRNKEDFKKGHIKDAVNVTFSDLPDYFENEIKAFQYEKIVLACPHGQSSSYATSLLRLMGYGNVYSLRWGMSVWNKDINAIHPWATKLSDTYRDNLETKENPAPAPSAFPGPGSGGDSGERILNQKIRDIFQEGVKVAKINVEEVLADSSDFFIINYERKDKYESGHLPGAVRYKPGGTLGIVSEMATIPPDKKIAVYCGTGHNSAFVAAYLRLFGYDAKSIIAGNNSFMHDKMLEEENSLSWQPFTEEMIFDYPYEKGN